MPVQVTYPGVYVQELPGTSPVITRVPTSAAAFVGYFSRGPISEAVRVDNMRNFNSIFGGLDLLSDASYAIVQFFSERRAISMGGAGGKGIGASTEHQPHLELRSDLCPC